MPYKLNKKNLAVARLMPRGKDADKRLKYMFASKSGTVCLTPNYFARVSMSEKEAVVGSKVIYTQEVVDGITAPKGDEFVEMPEGIPALTTPEYIIPNIDKIIPDPQEQTASFTCNAELLLKMMKVVCEVSEDGEKTIRLRVCPTSRTLRIDAYRQPGQQEFLGVIKEMDYDGNFIPGDKDAAKPDVVEKTPRPAGQALRVSEGRRFRG